MIHARWAMLGALGCVVPELIAKTNPDFPAGGVWFKVQAEIFSPDGLNYLGNPNLIHAQSVIATLAYQVRIAAPALLGGGSAAARWGLARCAAAVHAFCTPLLARQHCERTSPPQPCPTPTRPNTPRSW